MESIRLSAEEIAHFHANGCIGPFPLYCSADELEAARKAATAGYQELNAVYGIPIGRDLHLINKPLYDLFRRPEIREKVIQLLGDQLTMWRSDVFPKPPGAPATAWHQADIFTEFTDLPLLESPRCPPTDWSTLWQVTIWIALEDSTAENGCLEIIPGTHHEQLTWPIRGHEARDYMADMISRGLVPDPDYFMKRDPRIEVLQKKKVLLEAKAGEFYIFTQRVVHGSGPNPTERGRLAVNCRVVHSDVRCYGHYLAAGKWEMAGLELPLDKWGCHIYAGDPPDPPVNRVLPAPA